MLKIEVPPLEGFNEETSEFIIKQPGVTLQLEHSLVSLAKWEAKYKKPLQSKEAMKTNKETMDYIKCMTITQNVPDIVYESMLSEDNIKSIVEYMQDSQTATTIKETEKPLSKEIITAELIYYWMIELGIPIEFQKWHLSRLITLINVCAIKKEPSKKKKLTAHDLSERNRLNEERKKKLNSKG